MEVEDLEKLVTCSICKEILSEPKTLVHQGIFTDPKAQQCLHTFCSTCIQRWNQTCQSENQPLTCPFCRAESITVDVENVPISFQYNTMIQMYNDHKLKSNEKKLQSLNEAKETIRNKLRADLNEGLRMYTYELELSDQSRKRVENEIHLAQEEVCTNIQLQISNLQDHQEAMITRLNDIRTTYRAENDGEKSQYNETIQRIESLTNQCQHFENMNVEQFRTEDFDQLEDVYKTTVEEAPKLYKKPVKRNLSVRYIPYPMQDPQFGKIVHGVTDPSQCSIESLNQARCGFMNQFNIMTRDIEGDFCYTNKALIDVQIQNNDDGTDVHTEPLTESETGKYIVKYKAQKPSPHTVVVTIAGTPIRGSPQNVETIEAKAELEPVRVFETTRAPKPLAPAVSDTGEVAIVNEGKQCRIVLFSADGKYLREFGCGGTRESRLRDPRGVAFNDHRLLVSDYQDGYGCIKEFDIHAYGNYKRTIYKQEGMTFRSMCTTEQSIACLAHNKHNTEKFIKLFSKQTGDLLQDIKLDILDVDIPMSLAYDNNKYFVSFLGSDSIYVFDENGGLMYTFGEEGNNGGQFNHPRGLAVFGADLLLVCDSHNHRVQLLNQDGEFIRSFNSYGSGLGQMNLPYDVVVAPDGQVFVLEPFGKRVQVFK